MRVGILTYHRAENYGALLQAYALKSFLENEGYCVSFVDYWPLYHEEYFDIISWETMKKKNFKGKIIYILYTLYSLSWLVKRKKKLRRFMSDFLSLSKAPRYREKDCCRHFDIVIYGSDQIWRKQKMLGCLGYDTWYFGDSHIIASKKITYAASMGNIEANADELLLLKKYLDNFSDVSVREKNLYDFLFEKLNYESVQVLDPAFLIHKEEWARLAQRSNCNVKGKYILFYNLLQTSESVAFAERVKNEYGSPIIEIYKGRDWYHSGNRYLKTASVEDFLFLIQNAECVVSNSFHGVALSIIFEKMFYAVGMGLKSERVLTLLLSLGIEDRYVYANEQVDFNNVINYTSINSKLISLKRFSKSYLINALKD